MQLEHWYELSEKGRRQLELEKKEIPIVATIEPLSLQAEHVIQIGRWHRQS